jgi:hypothetical protein
MVSILTLAMGASTAVRPAAAARSLSVRSLTTVAVDCGKRTDDKRLDSGCYRHVPLRNAAIGNARLDAAQNDDVAWICSRRGGSNGGDKSCKTEGAVRASRCERLRAVILAGG